jgi:hypothetical protein
MSLRFLLPQTAALCALALTPPAARADPVSFSYTWSTAPGTVAADAGGTGSISFQDAAPGTAAGRFQGVATQISLFATAPAAQADTYTNTPFTLSLLLTDNASNTSATLTFAGALSGTASSAGANVTPTFTDPTSQQWILGGNLFTVTVSPPTAPTLTAPGSIEADITAAPWDPTIGGGVGGVGAGGAGGGAAGGGRSPGATPEPATAVPAGVGLVLLALAHFRRRRPEHSHLR